MVVYAGIALPTIVDGVAYCVGQGVPTLEADLGVPLPVLYAEAVSAIVELTAGPGATAPTYVAMQTEWGGDGVWVDIAWCQWGGTSGSATFVLTNTDAAANAFQQTRASGTAPGGNGSNVTALGGRIRFVGQSGKSGSSPSPSPSPGPAMTATIRVKMLGLR
jgi:hypothetical protein